MSRRAVLVTLALLAAGVALDVATGSKNLPGYSAVIGLVGGIAIILVSKWAGRFLSRSEDLFAEDLAGPTAAVLDEAVHDG